MHNDQISYNNDIEFFIYQTSDHLADLDYDSLRLPMTFAGLLSCPPLGELILLPLCLFLPLHIPQLMDNCATNAPSNDAFFLLIMCS